MAAGAEGDQVFLRVLPLVAARSQVMHLELPSGSAILTVSSVARQNLPVKEAMGIQVESERSWF